MSKSLLGIITVDINGEEEPNTPYKDQFNFPISSKGIEYEMMCQEAESSEYAGVPQSCRQYISYVSCEGGTWLVDSEENGCRCIIPVEDSYYDHRYNCNPRFASDGSDPCIDEGVGPPIL